MLDVQNVKIKTKVKTLDGGTFALHGKKARTMRAKSPSTAKFPR
jgi:hypothetical protein